MLVEGQFVLLTKVSQQNAGPLPASYWCKGTLLEAPQIGHCIVVMRTERCGRAEGEPDVVKCLGAYSSSPVKEMSEDEDGIVRCQTQNSIWTITPLPEPT